MRRISMCLVLVAVLGCQKSPPPRDSAQPVALVPTPESAPPQEFGENRLRFVCDVLHALRAVHDSKSFAPGSSDPADQRQEAFRFVERLDRAGREVKRNMEPWLESPDGRVRELADEMNRAGDDLQVMGVASRALLEGQGDTAEQQALMAARKEDLDRRVFMPATIAASKDPAQRFAFAAGEKREILDLIDRLFSNEIAEFDAASAAERQALGASPEMFTVLAFRSVYRGEFE